MLTKLVILIKKKLIVMSTIITEPGCRSNDVM